MCVVCACACVCVCVTACVVCVCVRVCVCECVLKMKLPIIYNVQKKLSFLCIGSKQRQVTPIEPAILMEPFMCNSQLKYIETYEAPFG